MRIAIVNDMQLAVEALRRGIRACPQHQLAWTAWNGEEAVQRCREDTPDLILMDLIMPVMDGVEAVRRIMAATPCPILIVTGSVEGNASLVFDAMGAGALDAVRTPIMDGARAGDGRDGFAGLLAKIDTIQRLTATGTRRPPPREAGAAPEPPRAPITAAAPPGRPQCGPLVAIGSSSGGPLALAKLLAGLPPRLPAPLVLVQHVDQQFAAQLTLWLHEQSTLPCRQAREGDAPERGVVYVAATNDHLALSPSGRFIYTPEPRDYVYRPSVDVFFDSVVRHWRGPIVGVLMTGMGRDGAAGLLALRRAGHYTIAQDRASSAVYGMPKAAAELHAACDIVSIDAMADAIGARVQDYAAAREGAS